MEAQPVCCSPSVCVCVCVRTGSETMVKHQRLPCVIYNGSESLAILRDKIVIFEHRHFAVVNPNNNSSCELSILDLPENTYISHVSVHCKYA